MRPLIAALALAFALAGCADSQEHQTAADCVTGEEFNPFEERCARAIDPGTEVCNAWLEGGAEEVLACQVQSDGRATLDLSLTIGGSATVEVRDGAGGVVHTKTYGTADVSLALGGASGSWTLLVEFNAGGNGQVVLWG